MPICIGRRLQLANVGVELCQQFERGAIIAFGVSLQAFGDQVVLGECDVDQPCGRRAFTLDDRGKPVTGLLEVCPPPAADRRSSGSRRASNSA